MLALSVFSVSGQELLDLLKTQLCHLTNSVTMEKEYQFMYSGTSVYDDLPVITRLHPKVSPNLFHGGGLWNILSNFIANIPDLTGYQAR